MPEERLQKVIARSGLCSRRDADQMIADGRVTVDGREAKPGEKADPAFAHIKVDGKTVKRAEPLRYLLLYKPRQVMTTCDDPEERKTVLDLVRSVVRERVYPVGRLDYDTEGILLLTNDGEMAYRLAHPKYGVAKIYEAKVKGQFTPANAQTIKRGVKLEDGAIGKGEVTILGFVGSMTRIRLTLKEGRKREVKQLCKGVGHPVEHLRRVEFAGMVLRNLKSGQWRQLTGREIGRLKVLVGLE
jgi:23S rRNA pseudouridine2605 synthase